MNIGLDIGKILLKFSKGCWIYCEKLHWLQLRTKEKLLSRYKNLLNRESRLLSSLQKAFANFNHFFANPNELSLLWICTLQVSKRFGWRTKIHPKYNSASFFVLKTCRAMKLPKECQKVFFLLYLYCHR